MTEAQFQKKVTDFLSKQNIYWIKVWGGGFQRAGIPDLICCVNGFFIAVELKTEVGKTSKLQEYNINRIREAGGVALVIRPSSFEIFKTFVKGVNKLPCPKFSFPIPE